MRKPNTALKLDSQIEVPSDRARLPLVAGLLLIVFGLTANQSGVQDAGHLVLILMALAVELWMFWTIAFGVVAHGWRLPPSQWRMIGLLILVTLLVHALSPVPLGLVTRVAFLSSIIVAGAVKFFGRR